MKDSCVFFYMTQNSQYGPRQRYLRSQCWVDGVSLWASLNGGGRQNGGGGEGGGGIAMSHNRLKKYMNIGVYETCKWSC